ncbi:unnamed protein product [marine sediment metagenome]|uniref:Uncharacterized protein n=1 Tax=marine sediment metagenome TaxID=412755 RepID=X1LBN2_9ZZZZ
MATVMGFKNAYHIAMPYPLGGAIRLCDKVIVKLDALGRVTSAVIEGAT